LPKTFAYLQEQLFFLHSSKYQCPQQASRSEDEQLHIPFMETMKGISKKVTCMETITWCYRIASAPTKSS